MAVVMCLALALPATSAGEDAAQCQGLAPTIVGTERADVITGTSQSDVIVGLGGADVIRSKGGDDVVCGGRGDDVITGGSGMDLLAGGRGSDQIIGGADSDEIHGGPGGDLLRGWTGDDLLFGGRGPDTLNGGEGHDRLEAKLGIDNCREGSSYAGCETIHRQAVVLPLGSYDLPAATRSYHAVVDDFDADGWPDVMVSHHASKKFFPEIPEDGIYFLRGDKFVKEVVFPLEDRHACDAGDVNGDGLVDLYCQLGGAAGTSSEKVDELWVQQPDGSFLDEFEGSGVADPYGRGRFPALFDVDDDGDLDLLLTAGHRPGPESLSSLWINKGSGVFRQGPGWGFNGYDASKPRLDAHNGWVLMADDGRARVFRRSDDRYEDVGGSIGAGGWYSHHGVIVDFDGNERLDAVVAHGRGVAVRSLQPLRTIGIDVRILSAKAVAVGDFDGDGHQDIYLVRSGTGCSAPETSANRDDFILYGPDLTERDRIPMSQGCGAFAVPIDLDGDGTDEVFVLNGQEMARGPLLIVDVG